MMGLTQNRCARDHWPLWLVLGVFVPLAVAYSILIPLGEAADETDHFALVRFIADNQRAPLTVAEREAIGKKGDASPVYHTLVAWLTQHVDVSDLPALPYTQRAGERFIPSDGYQRNLIFHTEDEAFPYRDIVLAWHLARLPSVALGVITVVLAYAIALALFPDRRYLAAGMAAFVSLIPRFVINSAVINDDNLLVPLVTGALLVLTGVAQGKLGTHRFILLGVLMGAAAATKYGALVLVPEVTLVLVFLCWRQGWSGRDLWRRVGLVGAAFLVAAGWWFAILVVRFNQVAELGLVRGLMATMGDPVMTEGLGDALEAAPTVGQAGQFGWLDWARMLFRTFWMESGALQIEAAPAVYRWLGLFSLVAVAGLVWLAGRRLRGTGGAGEHRFRPRADVWVLAFHVLAFFCLVAMRFVMQHVPQTAQGRHMYPALAAISVFFVLGWRSAVVAAFSGFGRLGERFRRRLSATDAATDGLSAVIVGGFLLALSIVTPALFILPVYRPYLPVTTADPQDVPIGNRLDVSFAEGLELAGFDLPGDRVVAGTSLPVTLYWHAGLQQERDFLVELCLRDDEDTAVACHVGQPVDGRYPMRAWEKGYTIRDVAYLPLPDCLDEGQYRLAVTLYPLRLDSARARVDEGLGVLPTVVLTTTDVAGPDVETAQPAGEIAVWVGDRCYRSGDVLLGQMRQSLTLVQRTEGPCCVHASGASPAVALVQADGSTWSPLSTSTAVCPARTTPCCSGGSTCAYSFLVDPSLPPGAYQIEVDGQVRSEPRILVNTRARDYDAPEAVSHPVEADLGDELRLLGYDVDLSSRLPGETIPFRAYWQSLRTMNRRYVATLHLLDHGHAAWGQTDKPLGSHYPNLLWAPGEYVDEIFPLTVDRNTPAGLYTIEFGVYEYRQGQFDFLPVVREGGTEPGRHMYFGPVQVLDVDRDRTPPRTTDVRVGDQIRLLGFDWSNGQVPRAKPMSLVLFWQASDHAPFDYTVFTQLVGPDGRVWAQKDNQPQGGRYPTSAWKVQEQVVDRFELVLPADAPSGEYRLLVGMYDLSSGQRLEARNGDGSPWPDNAVVLASFQVP